MKTVREAIWRVAFVAVMLTCLPGSRLGAQEAVAQEAEAVTAADDAYHYADWKDGQFDNRYTERWYFNFHDEFAGVRASFSYYVTNPENIGETGQARMVAVAFTRREILTANDVYPVAGFSASATSAGVTIDSGTGEISTVETLPDGSCAIKGMTHDRRLTWDLVYTPAAASVPWAAGDHMQVGYYYWEEMSWLVQSPRAHVTGTVTIDGRRRAINAPGYHDHNWGEWIPTDATWNWAQYNSPYVSLELADFIGKSAGVVALDVAGVRTVFAHNQYTLEHKKWAWDRDNAHYYPTQTLLTADNGAVRVQVTIYTLKTQPLRDPQVRPLPDLITYEQTASYIGRVWVLTPVVGGTTGAAEPEWRVAAWLWGVGFKEHSGWVY